MSSFFDRVIGEAVRTKWITDADHRVRSVVEYLPDIATVSIYRTTRPEASSSGRVSHNGDAPLAFYETARNGAAASARREMKKWYAGVNWSEEWK
jgi:hypothetical protein